MVPADGNFTTAIARGHHKARGIQSQARQHARLINLLGVKQIAIDVNKVDFDLAGYKMDRSEEMMSVLIQVGWTKDFVEKSAPRLPISGWVGDNLLKESENLGWWTGAAGNNELYHEYLMHPNARSVLTALKKIKELGGPVEAVCCSHGPGIQNNLLVR